MKLNSVSQYGILEHIFIGGGLEWSVFVRVTPNQTGSTTTWTFLRPDCLDDKQFEEQLQMFDLEIDNWKHALEGKSRLRFWRKTYASFSFVFVLSNCLLLYGVRR
ncbi:MAG: hypothetical protein M3M88_00040 [Thermoproteota archaeon]|nr:hypothetical protein [Thermoproteota archaeon]